MSQRSEDYDTPTERPSLITTTCKFRTDCQKVHIHVPDTWSTLQWFLSVFLSLGYAGLCAGYLVLFIQKVVGDGTKEWKGVCTSSEQMSNYTCVLAVGQFSYGIFSIGQISIGNFL
jgi:hypothetical protein